MPSGMGPCRVPLADGATQDLLDALAHDDTPIRAAMQYQADRVECRAGASCGPRGPRQ